MKEKNFISVYRVQVIKAIMKVIRDSTQTL